jgi:Txe/YoeB family toxin of Txe-Axe toxin-antitoxin module
MTCEVLVMNRLGLVLAADSAITFTSKDDAGVKTSFSAGANKIFQLSNHEPVGVMIFNNAGLQNIPWEIIIKSFRVHLGENKYDTMEEYAAALHDFIVANKSLFPEEHKDNHLKKLAFNSFLFLINFSRNFAPDLNDSNKTGTHKDEWAKFKNFISQTLPNIPLPNHFTEAQLEKTKKEYTEWLTQIIGDYLNNTDSLSHLKNVIDAKELAGYSIDALYKLYSAIFDSSYTGIVIAGYGKDDCFSSYVEVKYYGFINEALITENLKSAIIDHNEIDSVIEAFAQQAMVETFVTGYSPTVWGKVKDKSKELAQKISDDLVKNGGATLPANWAETLEKLNEEFTQEWSRDVLQEHYLPLRRIIGGLAIEEMSELAETLVMLESLKEKVTSRTQSVGGPIDVAVITKAEGLVWIKRKLFFDPEINQRYFLRQQKNH